MICESGNLLGMREELPCKAEHSAIVSNFFCGNDIHSAWVGRRFYVSEIWQCHMFINPDGMLSRGNVIYTQNIPPCMRQSSPPQCCEVISTCTDDVPQAKSVQTDTVHFCRPQYRNEPFFVKDQ